MEPSPLLSLQGSTNATLLFSRTQFIFLSRRKALALVTFAFCLAGREDILQLGWTQSEESIDA